MVGPPSQARGSDDLSRGFGMSMGWGDLTHEGWVRLKLHLPKSGRRGGRWASRRRVINGILYRLRTGVPWWDLPVLTAVGQQGRPPRRLRQDDLQAKDRSRANDQRVEERKGRGHEVRQAGLRLPRNNHRRSDPLMAPTTMLRADPSPVSPASSPGRGDRAAPRQGTRPSPRPRTAARPRGRSRCARLSAASRRCPTASRSAAAASRAR